MTTEEDKKENGKKSSFDFEKLKTFQKENKAFFDSETSKAIFALGVIVHLVFSIQQHNLGSTPFEKKLKGFQITPKDCKRIFVEATEKINQYHNRNTYKNLREFIAEKLIANEQDILRMPIQEISFNFVAGLELGKKFKSKQ